MDNNIRWPKASLIPLVYEAKNWDHGVPLVHLLVQTTAAQSGAIGVMRRSNGNETLCGYNFGDYFKHWLSFQKIDQITKNISRQLV